MTTVLGGLFFLGLLGAWALLRWASQPRFHDARAIVPASFPSLRETADDWPDEAVDRVLEALDGLDEHDEALV